jgi:hypothetical protein
VRVVPAGLIAHSTKTDLSTAGHVDYEEDPASADALPARTRPIRLLPDPRKSSSTATLQRATHARDRVY